jgi:hypothetical protein
MLHLDIQRELLRRITLAQKMLKQESNGPANLGNWRWTKNALQPLKN